MERDGEKNPQVRDPTVSVVVPNYNGAHLLRGCLESLRGQTYPALEIIVVDDGSTDDSVEVAGSFPGVAVVALPRNGGFAQAANAGMRQARGEIVSLLNNDAEAHPSWVAELVGALARHPETGFCASKMLLYDHRSRLNSAGDYYTSGGWPGNRGAWEPDAGQYEDEEYVFGACAGAAAYRRDMLQDIGLFDENLVMYCEDVDLSFRAQLMGYRCLYAPRAVVYHRSSATGGGSLASYYCGRNFIGILAKNMPAALLLRYWPVILWSQFRLTLHSLRHIREPAARARIRGQLAGLRDLGQFLKERVAIQGRRRVGDAYLRSMMGRGVAYPAIGSQAPHSRQAEAPVRAGGP